MGKHPYYVAFLETGAADTISQAIETYAPFVATSVTDITTRNLNRTMHVVLITGNAIRFYKYDATNTDEEGDGETVILDSEDRPFVLVSRGDRYDMAFASTGLLGPAEELPAFTITTPLTLPAGLPGSQAFCDIAPTGDAVVTFKKKTGADAWTTVFTITFAAGQTQGVFTLAADATLSAGDRVRPVAPGSSDATFAGFTATIVASR